MCQIAAVQRLGWLPRSRPETPPRPRAVQLLVRKGYRIVERNFRCGRGELDVVARDGDVLVFVEVRSRADDAHGHAAEIVDRRKQRQVARVAMHYIGLRDPRFGSRASTSSRSPATTSVIQDAFRRSGSRQRRWIGRLRPRCGLRQRSVLATGAVSCPETRTPRGARRRRARSARLKLLLAERVLRVAAAAGEVAARVRRVRPSRTPSASASSPRIRDDDVVLADAELLAAERADGHGDAAREAGHAGRLGDAIAVAVALALGGAQTVVAPGYVLPGGSSRRAARAGRCATRSRATATRRRPRSAPASRCRDRRCARRDCSCSAPSTRTRATRTTCDVESSGPIIKRLIRVKRTTQANVGSAASQGCVDRHGTVGAPTLAIVRHECNRRRDRSVSSRS